MGNLGLIMSEETYYGFKLAGIDRCFLAHDLQGLRRAISEIKSDRSVSLLVIEKNLVDLLSKEEQLSLEESDAPFFFIFDSKASGVVSEEISKLVKRLGISVNGI